MRILTYTVPPLARPTTVKTYLRKALGFSAGLCTLLKSEEGLLCVNEEPVRQTALLTGGEAVTVRIPASCSAEPNEALAATIVYEDEDVILYDKPKGMPVHPSQNHHRDTLANCYAAHLYDTHQQAAFCAITRLDKDTEGLCLIAKHPLAAAALSGAVEKEYLALAEGIVSPNEGILHFPIAREEGSVIKRCVAPHGKPSKTEYRVLQQSNDQSLLWVKLHTGRTHQIRVHFSHIGHPLVGDGLYGAACKNGHTLCCVRLRFPHPITKEKMDFRKTDISFSEL